MQEQSQENLYDYLYSKYMMKSLFGISMNDDDFVEDSYFVWRALGNVAIATHSYVATVDTNGKIDYPCNCEYINSVTLGGSHSTYDDDLVVLYGNPTQVSITTGYNFLPDVINNPAFKRHNLSRSQLHTPGEFLPYEIDASGFDKKISFDNKFVGSQVTCTYRGIMMDQDKNPLLTLKEAEAIAYKMAFLVTQKKAFKGDQAAAQTLGYIKPESERKAAAAKIPEYLSDNFIDRLLSAKTRHDRKVFYSSYKTIQ